MFSLSSVLSNLVLMCFCIISSSFFCLGFVEFLRSMSLQFSSNLETFQPLFLKVFFYLPFSSFLATLITHILAIWSCLIAYSYPMHFFSSLFFSLCFILNSFYYMSPDFYFAISFCSFKSGISPIQCIFSRDICSFHIQTFDLGLVLSLLHLNITCSIFL